MEVSTLVTLVQLWKDHGTKILGYAATFVATAMLIPDLIPIEHEKYWLFASVLLGGSTVRRGHVNSARSKPPES